MADSILSTSRRPLGSTGLECHPLGFGCYRVVEGNRSHEAALREYLARGGNLIDTSANYGDGRAEMMVGNILKAYPDGQAIVVTKGGYIQGENMELATKRKFPEVVEYGEGIWHSIHPEFLETQLRRSMQRLRRNTLDVYLLHNPEYFLEDKAHRGSISDKDRNEFYRRITEAFRFLESKVSDGEIRWYGISSNNFGMPVSLPTMMSIERCWEAARAVSANHHLRVVQLPLNLYESGGALELNNDGKTALEFCREHGIGVLVNRPLNAFVANRMVRLADFVPRGERPPTKDDFREKLEPLRRLEAELREQFDVPLLYSTQGGMAEYLEYMVPQITSPAHWEQAYHRYIVQPLERWATECQQLYGNHEEWQAWWKRFAELFPVVMADAARQVAASQQDTSDAVHVQLKLAGFSSPGSSLSQAALNVLLHLEGVSSVLVGMRRPEYVADSFAALDLPAANGPAILAEFHRLHS